MFPYRFLYTALILLSIHKVALAQAGVSFGPQYPQSSKPSPALIRELNFVNHQFLDKQRQVADELVRFNLGRQLHKTRNDLYLIQKLIDKGVLADADTATLQALGAAMGDVFAHSHKKLNWAVYEDDLGATHAVCLQDSQHCIFPMTLLSRRMEKGLVPDVVKIYDDVYTSIKPYFPHLPYTRMQ